MQDFNLFLYYFLLSCLTPIGLSLGMEVSEATVPWEYLTNSTTHLRALRGGRTMLGYPGVPISCYYCNLFYGSAGHYQYQAEEAYKTYTCVPDAEECFTESWGRKCCPGLNCEAVNSRLKHCRNFAVSIHQNNCVKNGEECTKPSDCCWKFAECTNGVCDGCLQVGEFSRFGCFFDADCCAGQRCGKFKKGICNGRKGTCLSEGEKCYYNADSCCRGLACKPKDPSKPTRRLFCTKV